ncbi:MAG: type II toxin-antitoxin system VapC family toxin [Desulfobacteraceae bacterium]
MESDLSVVYWDASAIVSALFKDSHSPTALKWAETEGVHLMSTLSWAEVCAVISRMKAEGIISKKIETAVFNALYQGPWRRMSGVPTWETTRDLCGKWSLRGADLWHLAAAKTLQNDLPELMLLTFDAKLERAAREEGLSPNI